MPAISLPPLSGGNAYYPSGRDEYAQNILLTALYEDSNDSGGTIDIGYPPPPTPSGAPRGPTEPEYSLPAPTPSGARGASNRQRIGIIGAGAAGLYTALLLDSLGDIGFDYDILEADPERIGGRLYTHWFDDKEKKPNEYFDIGAMRFPDIPFMDRTFKLIEYLGLKPTLIPYTLEAEENLKHFNGRCFTSAELDQPGAPTDPFETGVPNLTASAGVMATQELEPFREALKTNFRAGWEKLQEYDKYSTRTYMTLVKSENPPHKPLDDSVVTYLETFNSSTNLYDCAFSETVMDSLDFDYAKGVKWFCLQGGADQIATAMAEKIAHPVEKGKRVTKLAFNHDQSLLEVGIAGESAPRSYAHVVSTVPFGCLRAIDTAGCSFPWALQTAIRTLHYDSSVKVGIQFSERWWEAEDKPRCLHKGGTSSTDRPSRTIVYPSYGIGKPESGATMIASYTWAQDAARIGSLIPKKASVSGEPKDTTLLDLVLGDLAAVHAMDVGELRKLVVNHKAFDWYADSNSSGAFALFTPGQFKNLYPEVTRPVAGRMHFAGEATSVHHAWVVGALDSAFRCVTEILSAINRGDLIKKLGDEWGPLYEVSEELVKRQVKLGIKRSSAAGRSA